MTAGGTATAIVSHRPKDDAFHQQRLKSWQPILSPMTVIIIFSLIGVVFIPIGLALNSASSSIYEDVIKYDSPDYRVASPPPNTCVQGTQCALSFTISQDIDGPLYVYYGLENFYQNHRLYVKSQSVSQLLGKPIVDMAALERDCTAAVYTNPAGGPYLSKAVPGSKLLYPCGLIANSLFNDQFTLFSSPPGKTMDETNIAWASDFKKFNNPESSKVVQASSAASCASVGLPSDCQDTTYTPPGGSPQNYKYWYPNMNSYSYLWDRYPNIVSPVEGMQNEHFMVWMRTAALPTFRKLYGTVQGPFKKGTTLTFFTISDFDVRSFGGSKSLIISTLSSIGGRNSYIGTAFIVVGSLALLLTLLFVLKHLTGERRRMGDTNLLRWED